VSAGHRLQRVPIISHLHEVILLYKHRISGVPAALSLIEPLARILDLRRRDLDQSPSVGPPGDFYSVSTPIAPGSLSARFSFAWWLLDPAFASYGFDTVWELRREFATYSRFKLLEHKLTALSVGIGLLSRFNAASLQCMSPDRQPLHLLEHAQIWCRRINSRCL
jgi:hypothetical protein